MDNQLSRREVLRLAAASTVPGFIFGCGGAGGGDTSIQIIDQKTQLIDPSIPGQIQLGSATIKLPANSFPAPTQVTVTEIAPPHIAQDAWQGLQNKLQISCAQLPQQTITLEYPETASGVLVAAKLGSDGGTLPITVQSGRVVITIDPTDFDHSRGSEVSIALLLGIATMVSSPDGPAGLSLMSGDGSSRVVVFVHGLLQTATSVKKAVLAAKQRGNYASAYSFRYDWRLPSHQAGLLLAETLRQTPFPDKSVDIIGYSKGGLVVLAALRAGATKAVRRAIFLGTPFQGCIPALKGLYFVLGGQFMSSQEGQPYVAMTDSCLAELMSHSSALSELTSYQFEQNGKVDYFLFAGQTDSVVSQPSAKGDSVVFGDMTNGAVYRETIANTGHFGLDESAAVNSAYDRITNHLTGLGITAQPQVAYSTASGCWESNITIHNNTGQLVILNSYMFEEFDRYGAWQGHYWFNPAWPPGLLFPRQRQECGLLVASGESATLAIEFWTDEFKTPVWEASASRQARTSHQICLATGDDGRQYQAEIILEMRHGEIQPSPPNYRSRNREIEQIVGITHRN